MLKNAEWVPNLGWGTKRIDTKVSILLGLQFPLFHSLAKIRERRPLRKGERQRIFSTAGEHSVLPCRNPYTVSDTVLLHIRLNQRRCDRTVSHNSFSRYYGWHLRIFLYGYALSGILFTLWIILRYDNKKGTLFRGFLFMQLWFVKRRNYSSTLTYTPPLRQDSVAALAMRTGRRPSIAPTAVSVSLLIASTKEITWLMNAWL